MSPTTRSRSGPPRAADVENAPSPPEPTRSMAEAIRLREMPDELVFDHGYAVAKVAHYLNTAGRPGDLCRWDSIGTIMERTGLSRSGVQVALRRMLDLGSLAKTRDPIRGRVRPVYHLLWRLPEGSELVPPVAPARPKSRARGASQDTSPGAREEAFLPRIAAESAPANTLESAPPCASEVQGAPRNTSKAHPRAPSILYENCIQGGEENVTLRNGLESPSPESSTATVAPEAETEPERLARLQVEYNSLTDDGRRSIEEETKKVFGPGVVHRPNFPRLQLETLSSRDPVRYPTLVAPKSKPLAELKPIAFAEDKATVRRLLSIVTSDDVATQAHIAELVATAMNDEHSLAYHFQLAGRCARDELPRSLVAGAIENVLARDPRGKPRGQILVQAVKQIELNGRKKGPPGQVSRPHPAVPVVASR